MSSLSLCLFPVSVQSVILFMSSLSFCLCPVCHFVCVQSVILFVSSKCPRCRFVLRPPCAWKVFTIYWRCWCQSFVNFGTWQNGGKKENKSRSWTSCWLRILVTRLRKSLHMILMHVIQCCFVFFSSLQSGAWPLGQAATSPLTVPQELVEAIRLVRVCTWFDDLKMNRKATTVKMQYKF